ncbi:hypothetical protein QLX08_007726 [Tetragonisca angustula]|uniref:Uncharacterized protein n=1 Tax=Tetragonisca angustula TaxID=166442 RepID=A0AAW0ZN37_9HYME
MKWEIQTGKLEECGTRGERKWGLEKGTEGHERTIRINISQIIKILKKKRKKERCRNPRLAFDDTSRRCKGNERERPVIYTNFLLRCLVDSIAVCARDCPTITSITIDGIPLTLKYLNILCAGLKSNEKLINLSLTRCHIGDVGCDLLLESLMNNPKLCVLNLSSCRLSDRSATSLSLFLKRRKADLLQNVWEQSSVQSRDENSDKKVQGLQTLILNQNPKLGDAGLKQLIYALKSDVWLRYLSLRHCGINKHGAEMMIRLLQSNTRITKLDLTENRIPINTLQMILRTLKRRREIVESMMLKKRFCTDLRRNVLNKNATHGFLQKHRKNLQNKTDMLKKYSARRHRWRKIQRFDRRARQSKEIEVSRDDQSRRKKLGNLESQLLSLVESNFKLKEQLSSNKALLDAEARQRSRMEDELQKVSLRLNDLKGKVVMLDCVSSTACNESHVLKGLKYIFEKLASFSIAAPKNEEAVLSAEPLWSSPLAHQTEDNFVNCLQRSNVALFSVENITM